MLDEPGLSVFPTPADAAREIEPNDAQRELRAAFDDLAVPYGIEWRRPNHHRKTLFGLFKSVEPGAYRFVPAGVANPAALAELLDSNLEYTSPSEVRSELEALLAKLRVA